MSGSYSSSRAVGQRYTLTDTPDSEPVSDAVEPVCPEIVNPDARSAMFKMSSPAIASIVSSSVS